MKSKLPLLALVSLALAGTALAQDKLKLLEGKKVPAFKVTDLKGKAITDKSLKGKAYLLDFWASWCGPCKAASPTINSLHGKYKGKGFVAIGANTSDGDKSKQISADYLKEHKYAYWFTHSNDAIAEKLNVTGLPSLILVDKTGKVRKVWTGFSVDEKSPGAEKASVATPKKLEAAIKSLL